jgi:hypothetical protein
MRILRSAMAYQNETLPMLGNADVRDVDNLVRDLVSGAFEQIVDNVNHGTQRSILGLCRVPPLSCEKALYVFTDDPLGLYDASDPCEFVDEFAARIVVFLITGVTEALAREAREDEAYIPLVFREHLVG